MVKEPLYATGNEAADAGIKGIEKPKEKAVKTIEKIKKAKKAARSKKPGRKRLRKWFKATNDRRIDLINKQYLSGVGLTPEETAELEELQKKCGDEINRVHPLPFGKLEELEQTLQKLDRKLKTSQGS
jgi:hypothetical protein